MMRPASVVLALAAEAGKRIAAASAPWHAYGSLASRIL